MHFSGGFCPEIARFGFAKSDRDKKCTTSCQNVPFFCEFHIRRVFVSFVSLTGMSLSCQLLLVLLVVSEKFSGRFRKSSQAAAGGVFVPPSKKKRTCALWRDDHKKSKGGKTVSCSFLFLDLWTSYEGLRSLINGESRPNPIHGPNPAFYGLHKDQIPVESHPWGRISELGNFRPDWRRLFGGTGQGQTTYYLGLTTQNNLRNAIFYPMEVYISTCVSETSKKRGGSHSPPPHATFVQKGHLLDVCRNAVASQSN